MTHDKSLYPDPYDFRPERFLHSNGELTADDRVLAYGFGRRFALQLACNQFAYVTFVELVLGNI